MTHADAGDILHLSEGIGSALEARKHLKSLGKKEGGMSDIATFDLTTPSPQ
jgi:hypothetical protein